MKSKKVKGFTLVELLVFTAIAGIVMVILLSILISFIKTRNTAKKLSALEDVANYVFNELTQAVHWSNEVEMPAPDSTTHELKLIQDRGEPTETVTIFSLSGDGQLLKNNQPISLPEVNINSFTVTNQAQSEDELALLKVELELQYPDPQRTILSQHQTTISLRKTRFKSFEE